MYLFLCLPLHHHHPTTISTYTITPSIPSHPYVTFTPPSIVISIIIPLISSHSLSPPPIPHLHRDPTFTVTSNYTEVPVERSHASRVQHHPLQARILQAQAPRRRSTRKVPRRSLRRQGRTVSVVPLRCTRWAWPIGGRATRIANVV